MNVRAASCNVERQRPTSSSWMRRASVASAPRNSSGSPAPAMTSSQRSNAQPRLTAVGREPASRARASESSARSAFRVVAPELRAACAIPIAAAIPIAGAPRIASSRIASTSSDTLLQRRSTRSPGRRV